VRACVHACVLVRSAVERRWPPSPRATVVSCTLAPLARAPPAASCPSFPFAPSPPAPPPPFRPTEGIMHLAARRVRRFALRYCERGPCYARHTSHCVLVPPAKSRGEMCRAQPAREPDARAYAHGPYRRPLSARRSSFPVR